MAHKKFTKEQLTRDPKAEFAKKMENLQKAMAGLKSYCGADMMVCFNPDAATGHLCAFFVEADSPISDDKEVKPNEEDNKPKPKRRNRKDPRRRRKKEILCCGSCGDNS